MTTEKRFGISLLSLFIDCSFVREKEKVEYLFANNLFHFFLFFPLLEFDDMFHFSAYLKQKDPTYQL